MSEFPVKSKPSKALSRPIRRRKSETLCDERGVLYRDNGPAIIEWYEEGDRAFYFNGALQSFSIPKK